MGATKDKRANERAFHARFVDGLAPEDVVIAVMQGKKSLMAAGGDAVKINGRQVEISEKMLQAALALLPYRLPKLNSIDAEVKQVEMTHDEWVASLDMDEDE